MRGDPRARKGPAAYRLHVEYDGSRYHGWQRQGEAQSAQGIRTVAGSLERVLHQAGLDPLVLMGSGRTDSGVHALDQVAHLHLPATKAPSPAILLRTLNDGLPSDVVVTRLTSCPPAFHARHDALARSYVYQLCQRRSALAKPFLWWVKRSLDPGVLEEAWRSFQGFHDLSAFADLEPGDEPRCEIRSCELAREGSLLLLRVTASHFLRRQVRRMVGAAVACALGEERLASLRRDLGAPTPAATLRWSARASPASGLFLTHVQYAGEPGPAPLAAVTPVR
jgi:tRNA pseudouridine38-40 synthase